jgi:hypothetical protein
MKYLNSCVPCNAGGSATQNLDPMVEHEDSQDLLDIGTSLQQQFSKQLADMLKSSSSSDTEAMQVRHTGPRHVRDR